jgi:hypothetical protein
MANYVEICIYTNIKIDGIQTFKNCLKFVHHSQHYVGTESKKLYGGK